MNFLDKLCARLFPMRMNMEPLQSEFEIVKHKLQELEMRQSEKIEEVNLSKRKEIIFHKWKALDCLEKELLSQKYTFECEICGAKIVPSLDEALVAQCIFGGGQLLRYRCPSCGTISGPIKMFLLDQESLSLDYQDHYSVYHEGDSTEAEIKTFYLLHPDKTKLYLNYGAGNWSKTLPLLRADGYRIWGFDPYASAPTEYVISDIETLKNMRFDGIFSNNLIEHLRHPLQEFEFMLNLLNPHAWMSHTTPCYRYLYEYTRFHLFFYTGRSVQILCDKLGMEIIDHLDDGNEFINYTFSKK